MTTLFGGIQTDQKKRTGALFGGSSTLFGGDYDAESVQRSINNANLRIESAGFKPDRSDGRNGLERALNLPAGQNVFFDVLEVLQRPFQGVANVIDKSAFNGTQDVGSAFMRGISGKDKVRGTDLAENLQITNPVAKAVTGTALEIGLDPLTYVPGGAIAKGLKYASKPLLGASKVGFKAAMEVPGIRKAYEETVNPFLQSTKDKFGYMFNPDYKANETLFGNKSNFLVDSFKQTENNRRFLQEEYTNRLLDTAKTTGLDAGTQVGRVMEKNLVEEGVTRPVREMPTDPKINTAAQQLMDSNAEIRAMAEAEGIQINELTGYMTHILSAEERALRKKNRVTKIDQGQFNVGNPNKKILDRRGIRGLSAEDVNEQFGKKFFEPNAYFATATGQKRLIDYISAVSFRKKVLNNPDFAMKLDDFKSIHGDQIPHNSAVIDVNNYKFIKPEGDLMEGVASKDIGGQYVVTKAVKEKLDRYKYSMTDEGTKAFLRGLDTAQSWWKRMALFSVPYHVRNDVGNKFNMWVAGMSAKDLSSYAPQGYRDVYNAMVLKKESPLYREYRKQGLSATSQAQVEFARHGQEPEKAVEKMIKEGSKDLKGKIKDRLNPLRAFETSREIGDFVDQSNRFALFKWAVEKKGMSYKEAAELTFETLFDYSRLTNFEQKVMTRLFPFYRWMRNNLPYQVKQFVNDPRKYANLNKARLNAQEAAGIDENNVPDYMKEGFAFPIWSDGNGKGKILGINLPAGDLTKLSNPLGMSVDMLSPSVKLPIELATNFNMFYRKPIEKFRGQEKQFTMFGNDFGIPIKTAHALEQSTGQIGRGLSGFMSRPEDADQDTKFRMPKFGISSLVKDFDVNRANYFELRAKLKELQDYLHYIEQQTGERPATVRELNRGSSASTLFGQ